MQNLNELAKAHLSFLCNTIENRCVGSRGNLQATVYFREHLRKNDWQIECQEFDAFDWDTLGASVETETVFVEAFSSPYSEPCDLKAEVATASTLQELETIDAAGKIVIIKGELTEEQVMPKNFVFYNPDHHKKLIALLEESNAGAFIFINNSKANHDGGEYPFPIIEDGDFSIPSVFVSEETGDKLLCGLSREIHLKSLTRKLPSKGYNVIGRRGGNAREKITITAHIDAKKNTPGAIDNGTGVVTLLLLSELLKKNNGEQEIELVALNGEDYYSVPGQMKYIESKHGDFGDILLNINIDGAGLRESKTSYSLMELPEDLAVSVRTLLHRFSGLAEGKPWVQGDHSIFLQYGVPALVFSSEWFLENIQTQKITHTPEDNISIVDIEKITELAEAIFTLVK